MLWTGSLFILAFCCIFPLPFHTPAAASECQRWRALGGRIPPPPALPDPQVGLGLVVGELQHAWRVGCATWHVAMWAGWDCNVDHDPWEGGLKPTICWRTQTLTLDVGRAAVSPKDNHPAVTDKIFGNGWWLTSRSKCFQPLTDISEQYFEEGSGRQKEVK